MADNHTSSSGMITPVDLRAEELDTLAAILPFDRRDQLAALLTNDDVATLKHLAKEGLGANTLRAFTSDLAYLETWCQFATGSSLPWPAPESLLLKFVAHHLYDPTRRAADPSHGMPEEVATGLRIRGLLKTDGPHARGQNKVCSKSCAKLERTLNITRRGGFFWQVARA